MACRVFSFLAVLGGGLVPLVAGSPAASNRSTTAGNTTAASVPQITAYGSISSSSSSSSSNVSVQLYTNSSSLPASMSADCTAALMANISCSMLVTPSFVADQGYLDDGTLASLCTAGCASALAAFQSTADKACGTDAYIFPGNYSQTVPDIVGSFVWAHDVSCVQSNSTFCLPLVTNTTSGITLCSDCFLKYEAAMLGSEFGQERITPDDFSSLLDICSTPASSYPYTTPSPTSAVSTASGSTSAAASATPTCTGTAYTVKSGDSCLSVAAAHSIATDRLINANNFDYNCTGIVAGASICLPASCLLHVVAANDTCDAILSSQSYYLTQLLSWNPTIHAKCDNLDGMVGRGICISPPNTTAYSSTPLNATATWNVTFVLPTTSFTVIPANVTAMPNYTTSYLYPELTGNVTTITMSIDPTGSANYANLTQYCPITADQIIAGWTISDLPDDCESLLEPYCDPSDNDTMPASTTFPSTCSPQYWIDLVDATSSVPSSASASTTTGAPAPTQTGVTANCNKWHVVVANDTCADIVASEGDITLQQLYSWNPAIGSNCESLQLGYAVCVGVSGSSSVSTSSGPTSTAPSPVMPSTDPECTSYYFVKSGDTCADIEKSHSIDADEFNSWNPYIGTDCTNLWASEYICVGAPEPTKTTTTATTATPTSTTPSPVMPSTDAKCTKYHKVVSGDSCYDIEQTYSITANNFNTWNPYVGTDCANLWAGYYVCVAAPS